MSHHFILLPTMMLILNVPRQAAMDDLLLVLAKSSELSNIKLRRAEKKVRWLYFLCSRDFSTASCVRVQNHEAAS